MDVNLRSFSLLKSRLKCRDELIRELRAKMEADFREYSDRIEELTRERDALLRERDGLLRERNALQRERDALKRKTRAQELDIMQLKSDCEESRQELLFASDTPHSARPATEREDYEEDSEESDEEVEQFLHMKWIDPVLEGINGTLTSVLNEMEKSITTLARKYAVSYNDLGVQLDEAQQELSKLVADLTGDEFALQGLNQLNK